MIGYPNKYPRKDPPVAARLRYNSMDATQSSSLGDYFATIHKVCNIISDNEKSKILSQKAFTDYLGHLLPGSSAATTWLLKHDDWR
jgi:hypothetical protein